ncbi:MAG TPA: tetratricopeptide repeat protein [bacterium]|nr:tetratricopeptide repeat protein [bacterium]
MPPPPIGTVTFLFTDIAGSTALLQRLGDTPYADVLAEHRRILRAVFTAQGGQRIDTAGDATLVVFPSARDAVGAAVAAQRALRAHRWPEDARLQVRMGMHTGEPVAVADEYIGLDLHRAARICGAGHGGQILLSGATAGLTEERLPDGASLRDLGMHRLKDLRSPERLFQVVHPDLQAEFPPLASSGIFAHNLPHPVSSFVGRDREIVEVTRLISTSRLVTLTGAGGCGKTRLALKVAAAALEAYPDGVWLVELAALTDPALVLQTVASAVGVREVPGHPLPATVADHLLAKKLLLVVDNCEHLVEACAQVVRTLLSACEELRVLATSQEVLGIPGEVAWRVPSLSLPAARAAPDVGALAECEAVRLFVERAAAVQPSFALTAQSAAAVADVCRHLDGIPLAIELAAARVAALPVEEIAARLNDRFALLTQGERAALPRHRTLQAAMDWSYRLLPDAEQALLRRLAVFAGGWTLEAAEAVGAVDDGAGFYVLNLLTQLVLKSLAVIDQQQAPARYRFLETVRQYGLVQLAAAGEVARVRDAHLDWYLALAERAAPELVGAAQSAWFDRFEVEYDNLRAALEWSLQGGRAERGLRLVGAVWRFWFVRGHFGEGRGWVEALLRVGGTAPGAVRAEALKAAGNLAVWGQGDYAAGRVFYAESLALWREIGDTRGVATVLGNMAFVAAGEGDLAAERALLEESLTLRRAVNDRWGIALALHNLGRMAFRQGDDAKALALLSESLPIWLELRDAQHIAMGLSNLGLVAIRQGDYARARQLLLESLDIRRELGDQSGIAYQLEGFASLAAAQQQVERAARLFGAAAALREAIGVPLLSSDRPDYDRAVAAARAGLGEEAFAAASSAGRAMTLEEAVADARRGEEENGPARGNTEAAHVEDPP